MTGAYRGIYYFLSFALKHRLLVLVRTISMWRFLRVSTHYALSKNKKIFTFFQSESYVETRYIDFYYITYKIDRFSLA